MQAPAVFDCPAFRAAFPAFADCVQYPEAMLARHFAMACTHIPPENTRLAGVMPHVLGLLTAHLAHLETVQLAGQTAGVLQGATIDKVSVTLTPPPVKSQFEWWCNLTTYGAQLLVLLKRKAAGGLYVGGTPAERGGFRKAGGVFTKRGTP